MLFSLGENSKCKNLSQRKKRLEDTGYGFNNKMDNVINEEYDKWGSIKVNKNYKETVGNNKKEIVKSFGINNIDRMLGEFSTHRASLNSWHQVDTFCKWNK